VFWVNLRTCNSLSCGCLARKLTPAQVKAIQADTRTQVVIAKAYGVRQSVISNVKKWRPSIPNDRYRPRSPASKLPPHFTKDDT
jgi:hypothetical protein